MKDTFYRMALVLLLTCTALLVARNLWPDRKLAIDVYPRFQLSQFGKRSTVRVRLTIEPERHNRLVRLIWDSPTGESGASDIQLEGENGPRTVTRFLAVTAGEYAISATLYPSAITVVAHATVY